MIPLEQLLVRFKNLTNTEKAKKELIGSGIQKIVGVTIPVSSISFSKNTIFFKVSPIIKTEIFLKKEEVLNTIRTVPGLSHITDIK
ncbi:MAG: hypothetical protein A2937_00540 [Candidatus Yonathbacteria bacterium RIFCSPLOWO2_01_FULL_47_33b]|uniref:Uncharacterized protein n=1 Tax=Candidatus Yonathbacteria bacterium RIFCSPLOWO2_01_FULL_47_33b TaxID=1802727 RepID=A0A1G2SG07_9BACT|nr:MAG: hypothetical protein A2937_00540 [Candidatus Yonathbacteria bacterium RIFCSPLOWO2_01_FULL_47_33b]